MEFKYLHAVKRENKGEFIFFILLAVLVVLSLVLFKPLILQANSAIFVVIVNSILLVFLSKLRNKALKNEVYKIIFVGFNLLFFELIFDDKNWITLLLFNWFTIMYGLLFALYAKRFFFLRREIRGYVYVVNCFVFFYFLFVHVEIVATIFFDEVAVEHLHYFGIGIKGMLLFVSVLTLVNEGVKQIRNKPLL